MLAAQRRGEHWVGGKEGENNEIIIEITMIENSREGLQAKEEGDSAINIENFSGPAFTSRQWSGFRNPRIVRVSRTFGGKDRHSKVCTIRGLRDRRIRLSVPTAIQLYDLQDRLGLSQPSKVIDWLLEATKNDIDKLPPLQIPPNFGQFHQQAFFPHLMHESFSGSQPSLATFFDANSALLKDGENQDQNLMSKSRFWDIEAFSRLKGIKEDERGPINKVSEKGKWIRTTNGEEDDDEDEDGIGEYRSSQVNSAQKLFPIVGNHSSLPGNLLNNAMTYNSFHSDPSGLSLSQFGSHGLFPSQFDPHSTSSNGVQFPAPLAVPVPSASQLLFGPPSATPSFIASPYMAASADNDSRQFNLNQIQFLSSSNSQVLPHHPLIPSLNSINSPLRPFPASPFSSKLLGSDSTNGRGQPDNKDSSRS